MNITTNDFNHNVKQMYHGTKEKLLLMILPFWTPLMPPMGICSIKSYLLKYGYDVKTFDANLNPELWEINRKYFDALKSYIPKSNWGNFYNIGYNVLRNHLMAYINKHNDGYTELAKTIIYKHYYICIDDGQLFELDEILKVFYNRLEKYVLGLVDSEKPDIVGISVFSGTLAPSVFAFKVIKDKYPNIKTVMGGGIFSDQLPVDSPDLDYLAKKTPFIDKIMIGQGQNIWLNYLQGKLPESKKIYTTKDINGEVLDFCKIDLPDYSDFDLRYYPYLGASGSSSCPYQCSFCNVAAFWGKYRKKDRKQTVDEMRVLYQKFGCQIFFMTDSLLNPITTELADEFIKAGITLYWDGYLRVDESVCNVENTMHWRKGGFYRARMGIESGSQHVLDLMGKKITPKQSLEAISALAYAGIKTTAYFVIGHPGETEEDFQQTLNFLDEARDDIWEAECNPFGYYYTGQSNSDEWAENRLLLYPETARDMLLSQSWILNCNPTRERIYDRVFRFAEHCIKLGIPNPYSLQELYEADERWKRLHKNAVPPIVEFENREQYVNDTGISSRLILAERLIKDDEDFNF